MRRLPEPLALPLRVIPDAVPTVLVAHAFNHLIRGQPLADRLHELEGKTVGLDVTDVPHRLRFVISEGRLRPASGDRADVIIRGPVAAFWRLATRQEDPDTLFFRRDLCVEGETETGLHVKNLLDALEYDWDAHFDAVLPMPFARAAKALRGLMASAWSKTRTTR